MRKIVAILTLVGLVMGGALASASPAVQRDKRGARDRSLTFYLRNQSEGCTDLELWLTDGVDYTECGTYTAGPVNEVLTTANQGRCYSADPPGEIDCLTYNAVEGVPLRIDVSRDVRGMIAVEGRYIPLVPPTGGAGLPATLVIVLTGHVRGESRVIGQTEIEYVDLLTEAVEELKFSLAPDRTWRHARFESLQISLWNRGTSPIAIYSLEDPASFLTIPTK